MLSLERLGRPLPDLHSAPTRAPTQAERDAFNAKPLTAAVREVSDGYRWRTSVRFFKEIAAQAETEGEHILVADLARELGRRDLAVILGQEAHSDGYGSFHNTSFPLIPTPPGTNWTMVHAISRQESQFAMNALSHAGARGLMQLMPGTAREQAGKMGMGYNQMSLVDDASYNIRLGDGYFGRMMDYYGGAYPLAVGAYNAGPGNVNKWLRANGDPRTGSVDIIEWIERIPIYETKNYIQRVLENAVVYEAMNPQYARNRGPNPLSNFLGKRTPG
jgi:soluble lytic murein transglycosylase